DFDFRGTSPIENQNVFQPMFGDIYIELKNQHYRLVAGQTTDVVSPLLPTNLNFFPFSYIPGSIGFIRPMVRGEAYLPLSDDEQVTVQAALAQAIQTFQISNEAIARQTGWPDDQGRVPFGYGPLNPLLGRPMEFGASAHLGQRKLTLANGSNIYHNTYSINFDGRAAIGPRIKLQGEFFTGQLLGDYMGGVFQTFDVNTGNAVGAKGGWIEAGYKLPEDWTFHIGYGIDNVDESSVSSVVSRTQNGIFYANAFFDWSPELSLSGEVSWWKTKYFDQSINNTVFRLELALIYKWIGH